MVLRLPLLPLALLLAACAKPAVPEQSSDALAQPARGALVARVGNVELHEQDLQRALLREPGASPERINSPEARREFIDGLVRFELLAQAAERAGLTKDPDAVHALQQIAVTKLVNEKLGAASAPESITQAELEREYHARQASDFTVLGASQVRHIRVSDPKLAERLAARARAFSPTDDAGFAKLATANSEDLATRASGGDLGFVDRNSHLPPALIEAASSLKAPGEVVGPLRIDSAYEIVRLVTLRAPAVSPFSSVAGELRQRLYRERRAEALEAYLQQLRKETRVEVLSHPADPARQP